MPHLIISAQSPITVPLKTWRNRIQASSYRMAGELGSTWHDKGLHTARKPYRPWTFSRITGTPIQHDANQIILDSAQWKITSPVPQFIDAIHQQIQKTHQWPWGPSSIIPVTATLIQSANNDPSDQETSLLQWARTNTPVTWSYPDPDRHHTHFLSPYDPEFVPNALRSLQQKWQAVAEAYHLPNGPWALTAIPIGRQLRTITKFHEFWIEGYEGAWEFEGSATALNALWSLGWGQRGSQGYGMLTPLIEEF